MRRTVRREEFSKLLMPGGDAERTDAMIRLLDAVDGDSTTPAVAAVSTSDSCPFITNEPTLTS